MASTTDYPNDSGPIVDPQTLEFRRAITSEEQGYSVIQRLKQDSWWRNEKQAAIMRKFNDEPPYDQAKLNAAKQDWRRNASTGFMSSMVKRILPPYNQIIDQAQYLTTARFPGEETQDPEMQQKQLDFRYEITRTIRSWSGWQAFKSQIILENLLFGFTGAGWTDEITWEPRFLRQDEAYFPEGCGQEARLVPLWCLDQNFQIHEMAEYLVDPEASAAAGWNIDNVVIAINDAKPENRNSGVNSDVRKYQDMIRESSLGTSYSTGVKVIKAIHLFVQEVSGKVSHYIYDDRTKQQLFVRLDRFDSMEQNLALMAIEVGNGKLHGSKGAGRILYNTHVSVDQTRNLIVDNLMLSGLLVLKQGEGAKPQQALTVVHPVAILGKGWDVVPTGFQIDTDAFLAIDNQQTQIAEVQIGAFMPGQIQDTSGEKRTASEVNYVASIEQELRQGNLARFYAQFQLVVWECQKRICSIDNIAKAQAIYKKETANVIMRFTQGMFNFLKNLNEAIPQQFEISQADPINESAIQCCLALFRKGLSAKDIYVLGQAPSFDLTQDTAADLTQALTEVKATYANNPSIDQGKLDRLLLSSKLGERLADDIIIPQEDNTLTAEATRLQLMELTLLLTGEPVPVSPRDFDTVHLQVIQQKAQLLMQNPASVVPASIPLLQNLFAHAEAHFQQALSKVGGKMNPGLQPFAEMLDMAKKFLAAAQANTAKLQASPAAQPGAMPPAMVATSAPAPGGPPPIPRPPAANPDFTHNGPQSPVVLANPATAGVKKPLAHGPLTTTIPNTP
jgi:hypothetical protein